MIKIIRTRQRDYKPSQKMIKYLKHHNKILHIKSTYLFASQLKEYIKKSDPEQKNILVISTIKPYYNLRITEHIIPIFENPYYAGEYTPYHPIRGI